MNSQRSAWSLIGRALRWKPQTYTQAWLSALFVGLFVLAAVWLVNATGKPSYPPAWPIEIPGIVLIGGLSGSCALYRWRKNTR